MPKGIPLIFKPREELQSWEKKFLKVKLEKYFSHYRRLRTSTPEAIRELYARSGTCF